MPRYSREELEYVIPKCKNFTEVLRAVGLRPAGGNHKILKKYISEWEIDISHFESQSERAKRTYEKVIRAKRPIENSLVNPFYGNTNHLKHRLYKEGLKTPRCELDGCGQGEEWRGKKISLILDHINGVHEDCRLENLRIVCPNCNASLDTHCGKKNKIKQTRKQAQSKPKPHRRIVDRPSYDILCKEVSESGFRAVGLKYGVSDNAIRKWIKMYEKYGE